MRKPSPAAVDSVCPGSLADRCGIQAGDRVVRVNGKAPRDYIDYRYQLAESRVLLVLDRPEGVLRLISIEKTVDEDIGLRFTKDVFDGIITCRNRCPFCFVEQLPKGLRRALYVRDDDYRLSFLHGNFITLTNLTDADRLRIARLHLSPLYVSVHATEPSVREEIFGRRTGDPLDEMDRLGRKGIVFHAQIVVCSGINDGAHLERTVGDLAALHPVVQSIGVVPVGLTKHRKRGGHIRAVTAQMAREILGKVSAWQARFRRDIGSRLVFGADELYVLGGLRFPGRDQYEGFPQLGNGIGSARRFLDSVRRIQPPKVKDGFSVTLVTGKMAVGIVNALAEKLNTGGMKVDVCVVPNDFLGWSVTTAGLLAGADIARALKRKRKVDLVIVPGTAVREGEGFIDGMSLKELEMKVGNRVMAAATPAQVGAAVRRAAKEIAA